MANEKIDFSRRPPGWTEDSLTDNLERSFQSKFATFAKRPKESKKLIEIDAVFEEATKNLNDTKSPIGGLCFLRSFSAFRAAVSHAFAGELAESFPLCRTCLEFAGCGLFLIHRPEKEVEFLNRESSPTKKETARRTFTRGNFQSTIKQKNSHIAEVFGELYDRAIDFGGHPNEFSVTSNARIFEESGKQYFQQTLRHGDGPQLVLGLKNAAQVGVCALEVMQCAYPERFEILGFRHQILELRSGL